MMLFRVLAVVMALLFVGCAHQDVRRVRTVAAAKLECSPEEVVVHLMTETERERRWLASCEFEGVGVRCAEAGGCELAPIQPNARSPALAR